MFAGERQTTEGEAWPQAARRRLHFRSPPVRANFASVGSRSRQGKTRANGRPTLSKRRSATPRQVRAGNATPALRARAAATSRLTCASAHGIEFDASHARYETRRSWVSTLCYMAIRARKTPRRPHDHDRCRAAGVPVLRCWDAAGLPDPCDQPLAPWRARRPRDRSGATGRGGYRRRSSSVIERITSDPFWTCSRTTCSLAWRCCSARSRPVFTRPPRRFQRACARPRTISRLRAHASESERMAPGHDRSTSAFFFHRRIQPIRRRFAASATETPRATTAPATSRSTARPRSGKHRPDSSVRLARGGSCEPQLM